TTDGALEGVREFASKAAEHVCRVAGVLTLVSDPAAHAVSAEAMVGALTLVTHYVSEYQRLVGACCLPPEIRAAQALLAWLRTKRLRTVTARDVMRLGPNSIRHAADAKAALRTLTESGWLNVDGKAFAVHPATFTAEDRQ
ncbi:hypothetical protein B2A_08352, partial [mine drainage metagenome]